jgi:CRISPR-associated endonuclease/helicase Cas3
MSATLREEDLGTVDWAKAHPEGLPTVELGDEDRADERLRKRLGAEKRVVRAVGCETERGLAEYVATRHTAGSQSLVIVNRVKRAVEVFEEFRNRVALNSLGCSLGRRLA